MSDTLSPPRARAPDASRTADVWAGVARRLSLHSALDRQAIDGLKKLLGRPTTFEAGVIIAATGDEADLVTVVQDGFVCRTTMLPNGKRQIHSLFLPGETADAEAPLLRVRTDNLEALSRCTVWLTPKSRLTNLVEDRSLLAEAFAREAAIAGEVARAWVVNLGQRSALERIAHLFCEIHARLDALGLVEDGSFKQPLTQHDIADAQGLSAVHVNRVLQELRARQMIALQRGRLTILDLPGLQQLALFDRDYLHLERPMAA